MKRTCKYCKYYKIYNIEYCAKQNHRIYNTELECKYFKLGFLNWLIFVVFKTKEVELTDNCKKITTTQKLVNVIKTYISPR